MKRVPTHTPSRPASDRAAAGPGRRRCRPRRPPGPARRPRRRSGERAASSPPGRCGHLPRCPARRPRRNRRRRPGTAWSTLPHMLTTSNPARWHRSTTSTGTPRPATNTLAPPSTTASTCSAMPPGMAVSRSTPNGLSVSARSAPSRRPTAPSPWWTLRGTRSHRPPTPRPRAGGTRHRPCRRASPGAPRRGCRSSRPHGGSPRNGAGGQANVTTVPGRIEPSRPGPGWKNAFMSIAVLRCPDDRPGPFHDPPARRARRGPGTPPGRAGPARRRTPRPLSCCWPSHMAHGQRGGAMPKHIERLVNSGVLAPRHLGAFAVITMKGPISISELAARAGFALSTTSLLVTQLAEVGLVERHRGTRSTGGGPWSRSLRGIGGSARPCSRPGWRPSGGQWPAWARSGHGRWSRGSRWWPKR